MAKFCGPKLSNFCLLLSIWGIIMLLFLGVFFRIKSVALRDDVKDMDDYKDTSTNCFIAAGMYVLTLIIAGHQKWVNQRMSSPSKLSNFQMSRLE